MLSLVTPIADLHETLADAPVVGIDTSTTRFAVTTLLATEQPPPQHDYPGAFHGPGYRTVVRTLPRGDKTDAYWYRELRDCLTELFTGVFAVYGKPSLTLVEQPFSRPIKGGKFTVKPQSYFVVGVGLLVLADVMDGIGTIDRVGPSEWKLPALGAGLGNSKKPRILRWATEFGLPLECGKCGTGSSDPKADCPELSIAHDAADSLGIAVAAARRLDDSRRNSVLSAE